MDASKQTQVGPEDQLYLIWCTMLSFESARKSVAKNHRLALPSRDRRILRVDPQASGGESGKPRQQLGLQTQWRSCPVCDETFPRDLVDYVVRCAGSVL